MIGNICWANGDRKTKRPGKPDLSTPVPRASTSVVTAKRGKHSDAAAFPDHSVQAAIAFIISKTGKDSVNANLSLFRDGTVTRICLFRRARHLGRSSRHASERCLSGKWWAVGAISSPTAATGCGHRVSLTGLPSIGFQRPVIKKFAAAGLPRTSLLRQMPGAD